MLVFRAEPSEADHEMTNDFETSFEFGCHWHVSRIIALLLYIAEHAYRRYGGYHTRQPSIGYIFYMR